jgi:putative tricarboxylic transport membrane protein
MKERVVAIAILVFALVYLAGSLALKVGTLAEPGAGQFPAFVAACLLACAGLHAYRTVRAAPPDGGPSWLHPALLGITGALVAYAPLLRWLGFVPATFAVLAILFRLLGVRTVARSAAGAAFTTILSFVVFSVLLGVVLPTRALEQSILRLLGV